MPPMMTRATATVSRAMFSSPAPRAVGKLVRREKQTPTLCFFATIADLRSGEQPDDAARAHLAHPLLEDRYCGLGGARTESGAAGPLQERDAECCVLTNSPLRRRRPGRSRPCACSSQLTVPETRIGPPQLRM